MKSTTNAPEAHLAELLERLEAIRLSLNISQIDLARAAGVSRSTVARMTQGQSVSLDSFVRVMLALGLADQLEALLPDPTVRPVELVKFGGRQRRRARGKRTKKTDTWVWGDSGEDS